MSYSGRLNKLERVLKENTVLENNVIQLEKEAVSSFKTENIAVNTAFGLYEKMFFIQAEKAALIKGFGDERAFLRQRIEDFDEDNNVYQKKNLDLQISLQSAMEAIHDYEVQVAEFEDQIEASDKEKDKYNRSLLGRIFGFPKQCYNFFTYCFSFFSKES